MKTGLLALAVVAIAAAVIFLSSKQQHASAAMVADVAPASTRPGDGNFDGAQIPARKHSADEASYATAVDLASIAAVIKSKADAGDATAQRIYGQMLEECHAYSLGRRTFKADVEQLAKVTPALAESYRSAAAIREKRCARFTDGVAIAGDEQYFWYARAALKKDPQATAKILVKMDPANMSDQALREATQMVVSSKDPEALMELSKVMGERYQSRASVLGAVSGSHRSEYAWRLTACRLGANCTGNSPALIDYCLYSGFRSACNGSDLQEALRREALSPEDYEVAMNQSTALIKNINNP
ncbi:hypothetical protein [Arenimonas sp.]|uniref:hypothetical protein n=1 Tax=Arenimonas sp. TaxID=1872635 RepID=UPI002D1FB0F0|nr:hypothetical protein [Arenimonas sp.]